MESEAEGEGVGAVRVKQRGGVVRQRRGGWRVRQRGAGRGAKEGSGGVRQKGVESEIEGDREWGRGGMESEAEG